MKHFSNVQVTVPKRHFLNESAGFELKGRGVSKEKYRLSATE